MRLCGVDMHGTYYCRFFEKKFNGREMKGYVGDNEVGLGDFQECGALLSMFPSVLWLGRPLKFYKMDPASH